MIFAFYSRMKINRILDVESLIIKNIIKNNCDVQSIIIIVNITIIITKVMTLIILFVIRL